MGTWGTGNFDSDTAADHLASLASKLIGEIETAMAADPSEIEPDQYWGVAVPCNLELLALLADQGWVGAMLPDVPEIEAWKTKFLAVWDATIDGLSPALEWKKARRTALVRTFDHLRSLAEPETPKKKKAAPKKASKAKPPVSKRRAGSR
jgi:hypothetical protein